ncbi:methyltransferase family protein [Phaeobacter marinintestinus]|uniref:methyltransferase family protein n=1 Tax=Falsiphaeobacter marinintestinus TaxID=1492905 RepID=UPI0011B63597|nr:isoprenylcysteine carboxylmethyltransferase family protein [Phaeobacter marinintestinus]
MLLIKGSLLGLLQLAVVAALLIVPAGLFAGDWGWTRGWQVLTVYGVVQQVCIVWLAIRAPESLEARLRPLSGPSQPAADRVATGLIILSGSACVAFMPLDVLIWQIFAPTGAGIAFVAGAIMMLGFGLIIWTLYENRFAIPIVEDQSSDRQKLVDTGPYAIVRHPMYLGALVFLIGLGPCVGSLASLVMVVPVFLALVMRIRIEERMLVATLAGYEAYQSRRPYRVIPLIW